MSAALKLGSRSIALDNEGNLQHLEDWSEEVAALLAQQDEVELTPEHWEILNLVRRFHQQRGLSPVMRILVKVVEREFGPSKGNSLYLLSLFPGSPAKLAARIAGLPRPVNCL